MVKYALEKPLSENTSVVFVPRLDVPLTVIFIPARMAFIILVSSSDFRFHAVLPSVNIRNFDFSIEILSALCFLNLYPIEILISSRRFSAGCCVTYAYISPRRL